MTPFQSVLLAIFTVLLSGYISLKVSQIEAKKAADYEYEQLKKREKERKFSELTQGASNILDTVSKITETIDDDRKSSSKVPGPHIGTTIDYHQEEIEKNIREIRNIALPINLQGINSVLFLKRQLEREVDKYLRLTDSNELLPSNELLANPDIMDSLQQINDIAGKLIKEIVEKNNLSKKGSPENNGE